MAEEEYADCDHLLVHAQTLFPGAMISVSHTDEEMIHIDVDDVRYTFEIGSDDEEYSFTNGENSFQIPLMEP